MGGTILAATAATPSGLRRLLRREEPRSELFELNETGWMIYQSLRDGRGEDKIAASLAERYDITPDRALDDVRGYIASLRRAGIGIG